MKNKLESATNRSGNANSFELGTILGQRRAFSLVAGKCSAADVACLRKIRDEKMYKAERLDWAGFCRKHVGIGKSHADALIRDLDEFGPNYFQLSQLVRISADAYRAIAGAVSDAGIEFGGETIAITPENGPRIAEAVTALRGRRAKLAVKGLSNVGEAEKRIEACLATLHELRDAELDSADRGRLKAVLSRAGQKLTRLSLTI